jgi:hypothetical protein
MNSTILVPVARPVRIDAAGTLLNGDVIVPDNAQGIVVFEEPGALDEVARLATNWFLDHLAGPTAAH